MKIGIVGTCGRREDANKLNDLVYKSMIQKSKDFITNLRRSGIDIKTAVSGGAAYADAIAVYFFITGFVDNLILHLPCDFDIHKIKYHDTGVYNYKTNPGGTANYYHKLFSQKCHINSLEQIKEAISKGAKVEVTPGFKERNTKIANQSDLILAMTFGEKQIVKDGGTADTVKKFLIRDLDNQQYCYHLDINLLEIFNPIEL